MKNFRFRPLRFHHRFATSSRGLWLSSRLLLFTDAGSRWCLDLTGGNFEEDADKKSEKWINKTTLSSPKIWPTCKKLQQNLLVDTWLTFSRLLTRLCTVVTHFEICYSSLKTHTQTLKIHRQIKEAQGVKQLWIFLDFSSSSCDDKKHFQILFALVSAALRSEGRRWRPSAASGGAHV